ncbi:hypothetical protein BU17DRAFT_64177 [Hysterangium stoloniferum]|nr:hypothetical protein BU17DRAFT_64177 [Hysterangium stoloniferum]
MLRRSKTSAKTPEKEKEKAGRKDISFNSNIQKAHRRRKRKRQEQTQQDKRGTGILLNSDIRGRIAVAPKRISTNPPSLPLDKITLSRRAIFSNAAAFNVSIEGRDVVHALQPPRRYNSPSLLQRSDWLSGKKRGGRPLNLILECKQHNWRSHAIVRFRSGKTNKKAKAQIAPVQEWEVNSVCNSCCTAYMEKTRCEPQLQSDVVDSLNNTTSRRRVSVTLKNGGANAVEGMKPRGKTLNLMAVPISSTSLGLVYSTIKEPVMNLLETVEIEKHKEDSKKAKILGATAVLPLRAPESTATSEAIYVDRSVDQGDEARFWVELTHINRLEDALSLMFAV